MRKFGAKLRKNFDLFALFHIFFVNLHYNNVFIDTITEKINVT